MTLPLEEFIQQVEDSGILVGDSLKDFLPPKSDPKDAEALSRELVRQKKLTRYQAEELSKGNGKSLILGNYVLLEKIGAGGMGRVFKAEHRRMKRVVAIKLLPEAMNRDSATIARFEREVEAAAKLRHPNIVATDDADEANGTHFLVMEYVDGSNLSVLVRRQGVLPVANAIDYIVQLTRGLEFAHRKGVIHRDIKPANLLLNTDGTLKILDMGLARIQTTGSAAKPTELTDSGTVLGTLDYMSPEQAFNSRAADARSDIYSVGCTLFFLLTGKTLYEGDSSVERLLAHRELPVPSLRALRPDVSVELDRLFQRMVAKRPDERIQSASKLLHELSVFWDSTEPDSRPSSPTTIEPVDSDAGPTPSTAWTASWSRPGGRRRPKARSGRFLGVVGIMALMVIGLVLYLVNDPNRQQITQSGTSIQRLNASEARQSNRGERGGISVPAGATQVTRSAAVTPAPDKVDSAPVMVLEGHEGPVFAIAFSPDGRYLVSAGGDKSIRVWNVKDGSPVHTLTGHTGAVYGLGFGADSQSLISASNDRTLRMWDVGNGTERARFDGHRDAVHAVALHVDLKRAISGGKDGEVILWDTTTRQPIRRYAGHKQPVWAVAFHRDGQHLLSAGSDNVIRMWDADSSDPLQIYKAHKEQIMSIAMARDIDRLASASLDGLIAVWDGGAAEPTVRLAGHAAGTRAIRIAQSGKYILSGGMEGKMRLWDVARKKVLLEVTGHPEIVSSVALSPDLKLAASAGGKINGTDRLIRLWRLPTLQ